MLELNNSKKKIKKEKMYSYKLENQLIFIQIRRGPKELLWKSIIVDTNPLLKFNRGINRLRFISLS